MLARRGTETLVLNGPGARGRISAAEVVAPAPLPGFDNSQMDGFAVRAADLRSEGPSAAGANGAADSALPLTGTVPAGSPAPQLPEGSCMAVMTGAPIPAGADLVVPVEKTAGGFAVLAALDAAEQPVIRFTGLTEVDREPGKFIRAAGSDVAAGETVLRTDEILTPGRIGLLAACGVAEIAVLQPLRTLVISTGQELRGPGDQLAEGELYDANGALIRAVCEGFGHRVGLAQVASDDPAALTSRLDELLQAHRPHLLITAGGISAGAYEVVRQALVSRGVKFGSVAQQPGGPQGWGTLTSAEGPVAVIALPGNPVSCAVSLETLLRPALSQLDPGCPPQRRLQVRLDQRLSSPQGVRQFRRVELSEGEGTPIAVPVGGPSSHLLGHLARADALLELHEDDTDIHPGTLREAILL